MKPILPREFLWTDKKTIDEFFELDPINKDFYKVLFTFREQPYSLSITPLRLFNEVYYQATRMIYEKAMPHDYSRYVYDTKGNVGWRFDAALVMTMVYFLLKLADTKKIHMNSIYMQIMFGDLAGTKYWTSFLAIFEDLKSRGIKTTYGFKPNPIGIHELQSMYVDWRKITRNYSLSCVDYVLKLWKKRSDKLVIARLISDSIDMKVLNGRVGDEDEQIKDYLEKYLYDRNRDEGSSADVCCEPYLSPQEKELQNRVSQIEKEKTALQQRIAELESENSRLNALLEPKKQNGTARKFTLVEIVDYCKKCVEWRNAESIVAMLNKLLRRIATPEDSDLVDSIETEFFNRRVGNNYYAPVGQVLEHVDRVENKNG